MKNKSVYRYNPIFFLLGVLVYSLAFWFSGHDSAHSFGVALLVVFCLFIMNKKQSFPDSALIYTCVGIIFDSYAGGFPFGFF